jgi:beta-phosphoglucomutase
MINCCLFDLDGVIVDTARFHYAAWAELARELGFEFTSEQGEATKGVSRMASLEIVLRAGGMSHDFTEAEKERLADEKNRRYLEFISQMTPADVLPGVRDFLVSLPAHGVKVVLGSASKNAGTILDRCELRRFFDVVVDGTLVTRAKPDPEVFSLGAYLVHANPVDCVVFEDAEAGIEAATRAGMRSVGIGGSPTLSKATMQLTTFEGFTYEKLLARID